MPGKSIRSSGENLSCYVSEAVAAGQIVEADQTASTTDTRRTVKVAGDASDLVIGWAHTDGAPAGTDTATTIPRPDIIDVVTEGEVPVTYEGAANFGDKVVAAADGAVRVYDSAAKPGGHGDTPDLIIGVCSEEGGVVGAGDVGRLNLL
jgi:hypothetical protein